MSSKVRNVVKAAVRGDDAKPNLGIARGQDPVAMRSFGNSWVNHMSQAARRCAPSPVLTPGARVWLSRTRDPESVCVSAIWTHMTTGYPHAWRNPGHAPGLRPWGWSGGARYRPQPGPRCRTRAIAVPRCRLWAPPPSPEGSMIGLRLLSPSGSRRGLAEIAPSSAQPALWPSGWPAEARPGPDRQNQRQSNPNYRAPPRLFTRPRSATLTPASSAIDESVCRRFDHSGAPKRLFVGLRFGGDDQGLSAA